MKHLFIVLVCCLNTSWVWAIDTPDAPDYVAEFEARIAPLEEFIRTQAKTTLDFSKGYSDLERALDRELNKAYKKLMGKLPEANKNAIRESQTQWIKFRDLEFAFLTQNFNRENFGSSAVISRGSYRTSIIKSRVKALLHYLKNY